MARPEWTTRLREAVGPAPSGGPIGDERVRVDELGPDGWSRRMAEPSPVGAEAPLHRAWAGWALGCGLAAERRAVVWAEADGIVVGQAAVAVAEGTARIGMVLRAGQSRRGTGRVLVASAAEWSRRAGGAALEVEVWPHDQRALALCERHGVLDGAGEDRPVAHHIRRVEDDLWDEIRRGLEAERRLARV